MAITSLFTGLDSSVLLNYYSARLATSTSSGSALSSSLSTSSTTSATTGITPPWQTPDNSTQTANDAKILSTTEFIDTSDVPKSNDGSAVSKTKQDNQNLFALYKALKILSDLAALSQRDGVTTGQLNGYDRRFQNGLAQVQDFIKTTTFNNFTLQAAKPSNTVTSDISIPSPVFSYTGKTIATYAQLKNPLAGLSASDSFTISVTKGGVTTDVGIDLSAVSGSLTLDNVLAYANSQLQANGFTSRLSRVQTSGSAIDTSTQKFAVSVSPSASEKLTFSSAAATPSLYLAGTTGSPYGTVNDPATQEARLIKLSDLAGTPTSDFNVTANPDSGKTAAVGSVVDANGDVYVLGNSTGSFGSEVIQSGQDVYLSKYDSAGNLKWQELVGSGEDASAYGIALDPTGGVAITGATTAKLTSTAISDGNLDSFVAKYDKDGNQTWLTQFQTLAKNQSASVSVDTSGNVYVGGQVSGGLIGSGQTAQGGTDAYLVKLSNKGVVSATSQFGTTATDRVAATTVTSGGDLLVASIENGHAIVSKYAGGDITTAPVWQSDLGDLAGGDIGGLVVNGSQVYVSGATQNTALDASGQASIVNASSGGQDAFVFALTDNGSSVSADHVSYVGTSGSDKGKGLTVAADGTVYLVGTTTGTFTGETHTIANAPNLFVASVDATGTVNWAHQYSGIDGQSQGNAVALDTTGASVLDVLGLPKGQLSLNQPSGLEGNTTLKAGDSFKIKVKGATDYTATITIEKGETMRSLASKVTRALLLKGKASVTYANHGQALKIELNTGITAELIAGPKDFDALGRLGISPGFLTSSADSSGDSTSSSSSSSDSTDTSQVFGLGFTGNALDIASKTHAGIAKGQVLVAMAAITDAYRTSNGLSLPADSSSSTPTGAVPAIYQSRIANYQLALNTLLSFNSSSSSSSSGGLLGTLLG